MGEVAHLLMDAGLIVVATGSNLSEAELKELHEVASQTAVLVVQVGPSTLSERWIGLHLDPALPIARNAARIVEFLKKKGIVLQ